MNTDTYSTGAKVRRNHRWFLKTIFFAVAFLVAAVYAYYHNRMDLAIIFGLLGVLGFFYGGTTGFALCPTHGCGATIEAALGKNLYVHCTKCGNYFEGSGELHPIEDSRVVPFPTFAVPLPDFKSENPVTLSAISLYPAPVPLTGEKRALKFQWPESCCVCGNPNVKDEVVSLAVVFKASRVGGLLDEKVNITVEGIPHCAKHQMGVALGVEKGLPVLKFRWLSYRNTFCKLNQLQG